MDHIGCIDTCTFEINKTSTLRIHYSPTALSSTTWWLEWLQEARTVTFELQNWLNLNYWALKFVPPHTCPKHSYQSSKLHGYTTLTNVEISSPELHIVNVLTAYYSGCGVEQNEARLHVSLDIFPWFNLDVCFKDYFRFSKVNKL
jgi:hypothetical protein